VLAGFSGLQTDLQPGLHDLVSNASEQDAREAHVKQAWNKREAYVTQNAYAKREAYVAQNAYVTQDAYAKQDT
jgi:hypothetical protein